MSNRFAFGEMRSSNDLLGDPVGLQERLDQDSYLLFRGLLDVEKVKDLRGHMLAALARRGWVDKPTIPITSRCRILPLREDDEEYLEGYQDIQRLQPFHELAHDPALVDVMGDVLGGEVFPHPLKIARLVFPDHYEASTPPHQDYPNNQGTEALTATWIPVTPMADEVGGLAVLAGSHRWGRLPLARHLGAGNRQAVLPDDLLEKCRWVTTDYQLGDVLVFGSLAVHAARDNGSPLDMRLSVDYRYQRDGEALTDLVLHPHFQRLSWEEIYDGWTSTAHQYYWRERDYEVVPFESLPLEDHDGSEDFTSEQMQEIFDYTERVKQRSARRLAFLAAEDAAGS